MKILAVETSSATASVAVMDNEILLAEYTLNHNKTHSQWLAPMTNQILENLDLKSGDIDIYAASSGPGSFTGLRIGITTIKAIAYVAQKPVISVPTLDALAYNIPLVDKLVCPIMDARNNQVYTALYKRDKTVQTIITEYMGIPINELVEILKGKKQEVVFVGDAVEVHREYLLSELGDSCEFAPGNLMLQKASSVAQAARIRAMNGLIENCFDMIPFYLRKSQAEREYEKRLKG